MVLTDRDRRVIADVAAFGVMTRLQLESRGHFGSKTRANATLNRLTRAKYLATRPSSRVTAQLRAAYVLGSLGVELLAERDAGHSRFKGASDLFVDHQLLVGDIRVGFLRRRVDYSLQRWLTDEDLRGLNLGLVPDGYAEYAYLGRTYCLFLEADRGTEALRRWTAKTSAYLALAMRGRFEEVFRRRFFRVLVVTESARRLECLRRTIAAQTDRVFWLSTADAFRQSHPLDVRWQRPSGLFESLISPTQPT